MDARATRIHEREAQSATQASAAVAGPSGTQGGDDDALGPSGTQGGDDDAPGPSGTQGSDDGTPSPPRVRATGRGRPDPPLPTYRYMPWGPRLKPIVAWLQSAEAYWFVSFRRFL